MPLLKSNAAPNQAGRSLVRQGLFRFSVRRFLVALVLLLFATPFVEHMRHGNLIEVTLATVVLGMGVLAVGGRRRTLILATVLVLPAVAGNWAHHFWPLIWPLEVVIAARLAFLAFVMANLLGFILRAPKVTSEVLNAGISIYLLLGVIWSIAYTLVARVTPNAFAFSVPPFASHEMTRFNALYFSYMTLTTVGYGDITPVSDAARMLAMMEAMSGALFVGVLIARLVSLYSAPSPTEFAANQPNSLATPPGNCDTHPSQEVAAPNAQRPLTESDCELPPKAS
ncbi:MAG: potassium channel family protein [Verrucomicrobia bacterium]|nr:potassium channel family protein [Verrucomicrobiota bacterium]